MQAVVPPVPFGPQYARGSQPTARNGWKDYTTLSKHPRNLTHPTPSFHYPKPGVGPTPYPTMMYPVSMIPVHPGYAPWLAPHPGYGGYGFHSNSLHDGRLVRPRNQMSRSEAAVILQKYTRGWQVRKGPRFVLWRHMCDHKHSRKFIEDLINSFLMEEIIPDILIDILSGKKYLPVQDPRYKSSERVLQHIIHEDVSDFIKEIALGEFYSQGGSDLSRGNPLSLVSYEIIDEVVKEFAGQVVRLTVDDIVHNHMTLIKADDWLNDFILEGVAPMVQTVVLEAMQQIKGDDVINDIIDEVLDPQLSQVVIEAWRDLAETDRNRERQEVSVFAKDHFLDALCLQHLLSQVAGENFSLFFSDYTDQVLDGIICGGLTSQYLAVNDDLEATQSNSVLTGFHEEVFCDVALDVLTQELTAHLDEDMQELLELEKEKVSFDL